MNATQIRFEPDLLPGALAGYACEGVYRVAFSGGADSTALLLAVHEIADQLQHPVTAVHINHGYHPNANDWERHCADICNQLGVAFDCVRVSPDFSSGEGPEAILRQARYAAFEEIMLPGDCLLMAHHRDDMAETVLINLLRGSGVEGLAGIPESRPLGKGVLARPLLGFARQDLEDYLRAKDFNWLDDPTNLDDQLDRNFIRNQVMPVIQSRWPSAATSLSRSAQYCREAAVSLAEHTGEILAPLLRSSRVLTLGSTLVHEPVLLKRMLRLWATETGAGSIPASKLQEFCRQLSQARADAALEMAWNGWQIRRHLGHLWLQRSSEVTSCPEIAWTGAAPVDLGGSLGLMAINCANGCALPETVVVASRTSGQGIRLADAAPMQAIKELMRTWGVPPWLRDCIPIVSLRGETLAVGDWLITTRLRELLDQNDASLRWSPAEPALEWVRINCHAQVVENTHSLG